jgi:hypothetical protein
MPSALAVFRLMAGPIRLDAAVGVISGHGGSTVQDAQNRFQLVFRRFINVLAGPEYPLAVFLDDLQWLDAATLDKAVEMKVNFYAAHHKGWA